MYNPAADYNDLVNLQNLDTVRSLLINNKSYIEYLNLAQLISLSNHIHERLLLPYSFDDIALVITKANLNALNCDASSLKLECLIHNESTLSCVKPENLSLGNQRLFYMAYILGASGIRIAPKNPPYPPVSGQAPSPVPKLDGITSGGNRKRHRHTTKCRKRKSRCPRKSLRKTQRRRRMRGG